MTVDIAVGVVVTDFVVCVVSAMSPENCTCHTVAVSVWLNVVVEVTRAVDVGVLSDKQEQAVVIKAFASPFNTDGVTLATARSWRSTSRLVGAAKQTLVVVVALIGMSSGHITTIEYLR